MWHIDEGGARGSEYQSNNTTHIAHFSKQKTAPRQALNAVFDYMYLHL
jgi:hypothetical protein